RPARGPRARHCKIRRQGGTAGASGFPLYAAARAFDHRRMCGRFTHALTWRDIVGLYRLTQPEPPAGWRARYNLAPSQDAPVVRIEPETGGRALAMLKWGLVPFWAKEPKIGHSMINARAETVA